MLADMDFETYSEAGMRYVDGRWKALEYAAPKDKGLSGIGVQVYAEHPTTEVLSLYYDLKDGKGPRHWKPGDLNPEDLFEHLSAGKLIEAWNAGFEERIWTHVCVPKYGWPPLPLSQLRCAMAKARAYCLPGSLDAALKALKAGVSKDAAGKRLLNKFSIPRNPTKNDDRLRIRPEEDEEGRLLYSYNKTDIIAEAEISAFTPDLSFFELSYWQLDQECNRRGVRIDMPAVDAAIDLLKKEYAEAEELVQGLTDNHVMSITQNIAIVKWMKSEYNVESSSIDEEHTKALLRKDDLPYEVRKVLELRQRYGSAAVKKLYAMKLKANSENKVMDTFVYHGARTGRDAGRGIQPQNFPNSGPSVKHCDCGAYYNGPYYCPSCGLDGALADTEEWSQEAADFAIQQLHNGCFGWYFVDTVAIISGCLRGLMIPEEGFDFVGTDYSAIEAVVAACLSGCQWRIDTFKNKEDIYLKSAEMITGRSSIEDRKLGKVAELASGYGGWTGAWKQFGAEKFFANDAAIVAAIKAWRNASPEIVEAWGGQQKNWKPFLYGLEGDFIRAFYNPNVETPSVCNTSFYYDSRHMFLRLPSGRYITYHNAKVSPHPTREGKMRLAFEGWNSNPKMGAMGWVALETYGGRLFENVVQAVARDLMAFAALNLQREGYFVALRVHDELVAQVPEGFGSVEELESICNTLPFWASDWPVRVSGGWRGKRYRK